MKIGSPELAIIQLMLLWSLQMVLGIRFVIDKEECLSHKIDYAHINVLVSFVVIKAEGAWHLTHGVDLVVKGPYGNHIREFQEKTSEKFEFISKQAGLHHFCFTNKSPYHETIDFDVHASHLFYHDQHAKDEHFTPLLEQIARLEDALYNIQFEQHWLEAQTERQAIVNEEMSQRAILKAVLESAALVSVSILQVYLLRRLFDRRFRTHRV